MTEDRLATAASRFGSWDTEHGLPVFRYTADPADPATRWDPMTGPPTNLHWTGVGNRRLQLVAYSDGTTGVWDTATAYRWISGAEPGTGVSIVTVDGEAWGTDAARWPAAGPPVRTWGPTWFSVTAAAAGVHLQLTVLCPDGEVPWVLVRVELSADRTVAVTLDEQWACGATVVSLPGLRAHRESADRRNESTMVASADATGVTAREVLGAAAGDGAFGPAVVLRLEQVGGDPPAADAIVSEGDPPSATLRAHLDVAAGKRVVRWYRYGYCVEDSVDDPEAVWAASIDALGRRLPSGRALRVPALARELPWHAAVLTGGACVDDVIGGHTLDQSSAYTFSLGFNGAARDPLQHALPLVYSEPDLALSVLRNTCGWAGPDGELPYALDGAKQPWTDLFQPSDQALWSLWLAAEYAAATGDLVAFAAPAPFHPMHHAAPAPLVDHLVAQFRHLVDVVGVGERGHIRILNADWNDSALHLAGVEPGVMAAQGESVLNSAMAAWVLPRFAGLARRLGRLDIAAEADARADDLRERVAEAWNGRWFHRAYGPGAVIGDGDLWLEVQPWAVLCGAADDSQASSLLATINTKLRHGSPLGARLRWPLSVPGSERHVGEGTAGGTWFSISMTLAWAAAGRDPDQAWSELSCMTLAAHTAAYPDVWEGTISGPDSYNTPEAERPGRTWAWPEVKVAMQSFPVNNLHAHAQVIFTYLRLLGVEPTVDGALRVGTGGTFHSPTISLDTDGHGWVRPIGSVTIESPHGTVTGGPGVVRW